MRMNDTCSWSGCSKSGPLFYLTFHHRGKEKTVGFCGSHYSKAAKNVSAETKHPIDVAMRRLFGRRFQFASFDTFNTNEDFLEEYLGIEDGKKIRSLQAAKGKAMAFAEHSAGEGDGSLVLTGQEGVGKTHLTAAASRLLLKRGYTVGNEMSTTLVERIRHTYNKSHGDQENTVREIISGISSKNVVILQDIRESCFSRDIRDYMHSILDNIYNEQKIVMVTSNFDIEDLRKPDNFGPHLVDRLVDPPSWLSQIKSTSFRVAKFKSL